MSAPSHKRASRSHGLIAASVASMIGLILMVLGHTWMAAPRPESNVASRRLAPAGHVPASALSPARARALLADMAPLPLPTHGPKGDGVKSTLLCFCLHKGPETVRELRRLAAEKFIQGLNAFADANYQAAADAFDQAIQRHPREARAFVNRALAYVHLERYREARADLTQAIALHETLADAYYGRGLVAIFSGDRDGANTDIRHAAQLGDERALRLSQAAIQPVREG